MFPGAQTVSRTVGRNALTEGATLAALLGGGGYLATPFLTKRFMRSALLRNKSRAERERIIAEAERNGVFKRLARAAGVTGAALGAGYGLYKHELVPRWLAAGRYGKSKPYMHAPYHSGRTPLLPKSAGFGDLDNPFLGERIPVKHSIDLINSDPFLTFDQKAQTEAVIANAEQRRSGLVSGKALASSALRLGAGFVPAYYFGKGVGSLLALPPDTTRTLSRIGGIAGAVLNSGIIGE